MRGITSPLTLSAVLQMRIKVAWPNCEVKSLKQDPSATYCCMHSLGLSVGMSSLVLLGPTAHVDIMAVSDPRTDIRPRPFEPVNRMCHLYLFLPCMV